VTAAAVDLSIRLGSWDVALLVVVSAQATVIAYLHRPAWKVLVLSLPLPFTLASLALGRPIGVTHVAGGALLLAFPHAVRLLHVRANVPIVPAISVSAVAYGLAATALVAVLPTGPAAFWTVAAVVVAVAAAAALATRHHEERGHRSPLPVWIKLPIIAGVIFVLIVTKQALRGFMALFPMLTIVTTYEARHSLWSVCRQMPLIILSLASMMVCIRLTQGRLGKGPALAIGWVVYLSILLPLTWRMWFSRTSRAAIAAAPALPAGTEEAVHD